MGICVDFHKLYSIWKLHLRSRSYLFKNMYYLFCQLVIACERTLSWIFNKLFGLLFNIKLSSSVVLVQMFYFLSVSFSFNILLVYLSCTHGLFICCLLSSVPKLKCLLCFFSSALYSIICSHKIHPKMIQLNPFCLWIVLRFLSHFYLYVPLDQILSVFSCFSQFFSSKISTWLFYLVDFLLYPLNFILFRFLIFYL